MSSAAWLQPPAAPAQAPFFEELYLFQELASNTPPTTARATPAMTRPMPVRRSPTLRGPSSRGGACCTSCTGGGTHRRGRRDGRGRDDRRGRGGRRGGRWGRGLLQLLHLGDPALDLVDLGRRQPLVLGQVLLEAGDGLLGVAQLLVAAADVAQV